jgi:WD40 repeat protein
VGNVSAVAFSLDGKYLTARASQSERPVFVSESRPLGLRVWEAKTGREVARVDQQYRSTLTGVVFSPDGTHFATADPATTARVFDATNGREISHMSHDDPLLDIAFSPDGRMPVTGSERPHSPYLVLAVGRRDP